MKYLLTKLKPLYYLLVFVSIAVLFGGAYLFYLRLDTISGDLQKLKGKPNVALMEPREFTSVNQDACGESCKSEIEKQVAEQIANKELPKSTTTVEKTTTVVAKTPQTSYITLGTTSATQETDWIDVDASGVYIDMENDYGKDATVSWEVSLKVDNANGKAFARLWDDTNKIAVDGSELSTENNADFISVSSKNLPFWRGRNLYKIQLKSLNSFEITYTSGRIKIQY